MICTIFRGAVIPTPIAELRGVGVAILVIAVLCKRCYICPFIVALEMRVIVLCGSMDAWIDVCYVPSEHEVGQLFSVFCGANLDWV